MKKLEIYWDLEIDTMYLMRNDDVYKIVYGGLLFNRVMKTAGAAHHMLNFDISKTDIFE